MEIRVSAAAEAQIAEWKKDGRVDLLKKVRSLLQAIMESPYTGIGKPEALRHELTGKWSRRVSKEHRIIYEVQENIIFIFSVKGHYE